MNPFMTFGEAVKEMLNGALVRRVGWNGKGMHVYLEDASTFKIGEGAFKGETRRYEPYFVMFTAQKTHQPGWHPSTPDILAVDWELVHAS